MDGMNSILNLGVIQIDEILKELNVSRATIYRWMNAGKFPKPIDLGSRSLRWKKTDIEQWASDLKSRREAG